MYIQMSDGAKRAADLFVPRGVSLDTPMPTILHQTRYTRTMCVAWPFSLLIGNHWSIRSDKSAMWMCGAWARVGDSARLISMHAKSRTTRKFWLS